MEGIQDGILEKEMATPSSILAWKILWTGEPGQLQSYEVTKSGRRLSSHIQDGICRVHRTARGSFYFKKEHQGSNRGQC